MKVILVVVIAIATLAVANCDDAPFKCDPSRTYEENKCNSCSCTTDDAFMCTLKLCSGDPHESMRKCEVGSKYAAEDGNQCWCVKEMGTICTISK